MKVGYAPLVQCLQKLISVNAGGGGDDERRAGPCRYCYRSVIKTSKFAEGKDYVIVSMHRVEPIFQIDQSIAVDFCIYETVGTCEKLTKHRYTRNRMAVSVFLLIDGKYACLAVLCGLFLRSREFN